MRIKVEVQERAKVGDVVQLDPHQCRWGAVFVVVESVRSWGIQGYFLVPGGGGEGGPVILKNTGAAYIRANHEHYVRIGKAEWVLKPNAGEEPL